MKTPFELFAAWHPGPVPAPPRPAPDAEAQQRWEGEGGNNQIRQRHAAGDTDPGRLYASYVQAWRARFGRPAPFAPAVPIPIRGSKTKP